MAQATEPEFTSQDLYAEFYGVVCDAVERAWHHWPAEPKEDDFSSTSDYARRAANRVLEALTVIRDEDTRLDSEIDAAEDEYCDRLWYYRTVVGRTRDQIPTEALEPLARIESTYTGLSTDPLDVARVEGKLSALRWVRGYEWDFLDT